MWFIFNAYPCAPFVDRGVGALRGGKIYASVSREDVVWVRSLWEVVPLHIIQR